MYQIKQLEYNCMQHFLLQEMQKIKKRRRRRKNSTTRHLSFIYS
jgi:hypothetical protein